MGTTGGRPQMKTNTVRMAQGVQARTRSSRECCTTGRGGLASCALTSLPRNLGEVHTCLGFHTRRAILSSTITFCVKYPEISTGLTKQELEQIDGRLVAVRRKVARGERLFQAGDRFDTVFAVWTGFFKTTMASKDGREQVTGFQMAGELMGLDGIGSRVYEVDAVALEDSQVCVMPFDDLRRWHWRSTHCCSSSIA